MTNVTNMKADSASMDEAKPAVSTTTPAVTTPDLPVEPVPDAPQSAPKV
jgi:hypothetical protein